MGSVVFNFFLLTLASFAVIGYDITIHGSLESSRTGRYLKDAGLLIHVKPYYKVVEDYTLSAYKWGKQNFPHEGFAQFKNQSVEVKKKVTEYAKTTFTNVKHYSNASYYWTKEQVSPYLSDTFLKLFSIGYDFSVDVWAKVVKVAFDFKAWCAENITRENITWENFEKGYFSVAQQIKVYYSNISSWVARKVNCLMTS